MRCRGLRDRTVRITLAGKAAGLVIGALLGQASASPALLSEAAVLWGNLHIGNGGSTSGVTAADYADGYPSPQNPVPAGDFAGNAHAASAWSVLRARVRCASASGIAFVQHPTNAGASFDDTLTIVAPGQSGAGQVRYVVSLHGRGVSLSQQSIAGASLFFQHNGGFLQLANVAAAGAVTVTPPLPFNFGEPFSLYVRLESQANLVGVGTIGVTSADFVGAIVAMIVTTPSGAPVVGPSISAQSGGAYPAPAPCPGDATNDGRTDFLDLNAVLSNYGVAGAVGSLLGDVNFDGVVNFTDLNAVLSSYGTAC